MKRFVIYFVLLNIFEILCLLSTDWVGVYITGFKPFCLFVLIQLILGNILTVIVFSRCMPMPESDYSILRVWFYYSAMVNMIGVVENSITIFDLYME